ncbi:MAG: hypothetical protein M0P27_08940 [Bacteroidales bacterium]|nr:hypothetical protein [Bacteroidales bacterium]
MARSRNLIKFVPNLLIEEITQYIKEDQKLAGQQQEHATHRHRLTSE